MFACLAPYYVALSPSPLFWQGGRAAWGWTRQLRASPPPPALPASEALAPLALRLASASSPPGFLAPLAQHLPPTFTPRRSQAFSSYAL